MALGKSKNKKAPVEVNIDNKSRAKLFAKDKAKTLISNIGFYLMFALDILFFVILLVSGYEVFIAVFLGIALGLELIVILSMLPVPVLQVGVVQKNILKKAVYLLAPVLEIIWGLLFLGYGTVVSGAVFVYLLLGVARVIMWVASFFLSKKGIGAGGASTVFAVIAIVFVFATSGAIFEFPICDRPIVYSHTSEYGGGFNEYGSGYIVSDVLPGLRDNVKIPSVYKGEKVVAVEFFCNTMGTLELPETVKYINVYSESLVELTVNADGADMSDSTVKSLETLIFKGENELPQSLPKTDSALRRVSISKPLIDTAMREESNGFAAVRELLVPEVENNEHYVMFYTDCHLDEEDLGRSTVIDGFYEKTLYGANELPDPDLGDDYQFLGWYTSRDYRDGERETYASGASNLKLYAKYRYLYDINLYNGIDSATPSWGIKYHKESRDENLPTPENNPALERNGYAFCGWFDKSNNSPVKNNDIKFVATGSKGNKDFYPVYKKLYSVTLHTDGANSYDKISNMQFHEWSDFEELGNATKTGYTFMGWFSDSSYSNKVTRFPLTVGSSSQVINAQNCDLYLKFNLNYNITFNPGGGSYSSSGVPSYYHVESPIITLPTATRTGYTFNGWYMGDTRYNNIPTGSTGNKVYTAQWTPITYRVQYNSGADDTSGSVPSTDTFTYDAESSLAATSLTRTGYTFAGWSVLGRTYNPGEEQVFNFASSQNTTVTATAQWTPIHYTIKYDRGDGSGTAMENSDFTYDANNTLRSCTYTKTGYHFAGWKADGVDGVFNGSTKYNFTATANSLIMLTAQWEANRYTVSYVAGAEGVTGSTSDSTFVYDANNNIAANGFTRPGYTFTGWKADGDAMLYKPGLAAHNFTSEENGRVTLTAQWQANTYTVIYDKNSSAASGSMDNDTFTYDAVNTIKECGYSRLGYHFDGWVFEGEEKKFLPGIYEYNFATSGTVTLKASWIANNYTVVYDKNAADATGTVENSSFTYDSYNRLREDGFTRIGYHFTGWKMDGVDRIFNAGTSYDYNFTAEQGGTVTLKAQWTPNGYTVNYSAGATIGVSGSTESQHFLYGEAHTLRECGFTREGYEFIGWQVTVNGVTATYQAGESVPELATEHGATVTVTALWEKTE